MHREHTLMQERGRWDAYVRPTLQAGLFPTSHGACWNNYCAVRCVHTDTLHATGLFPRVPPDALAIPVHGFPLYVTQTG